MPSQLFYKQIFKGRTPPGVPTAPSYTGTENSGTWGSVTGWTTTQPTASSSYDTYYSIANAVTIDGGTTWTVSMSIPFVDGSDFDFADGASGGRIKVAGRYSPDLAIHTKLVDLGFASFDVAYFGWQDLVNSLEYRFFVHSFNESVTVDKFRFLSVSTYLYDTGGGWSYVVGLGHALIPTASITGVQQAGTGNSLTGTEAEYQFGGTTWCFKIDLPAANAEAVIRRGTSNAIARPASGMFVHGNFVYSTDSNTFTGIAFFEKGKDGSSNTFTGTDRMGLYFRGVR